MQSIESTLETKRTGPANWPAIYSITLCVFVLIASEFMPVSLLSPIAHDLQLTEGQAGQAISVSGVFAFFSSLLISLFAGRSDRKNVLLLMTSLLIVSGTFVAFAPSYIVLLIGRAFVGVAIGGFWSMSAAVTMRLVPKESIPRAFTFTNGGNAVASIVAAPLGSFLGGMFGWRWTFFCVVPLSLISMVWLYFSLPSLPSERVQDRGGFRKLLKDPAFVIGIVSLMAFFMGQFSLFTYLRPFLEQVTRVSITQLSSVLLLIGITGFIGTVLIGKIIGERLHVLLGTLPAILAVLAFMLSMFGQSLIATCILLAIWGLIATALPVAWWTWMTRAAPHDPEVGGALLVASVQFSITLGAAVGGLVFDSSGPRIAFVVSSAILLFASVLGFRSKTIS